MLDQLVGLAARHRAQTVLPRLQPMVKWPAGKPPQFDWDDYDSLVRPWLGGPEPARFWPLPRIDYLDRFDLQSQADYWASAASHFDQLDWIAQAPLILDPPPGLEAQSLRDSAWAGRLLAINPMLRVVVPLRADEVVLGDKGVAPADAKRLTVAAEGLVYAPPTRPWPAEVAPPEKWLRGDVPGLLPYVGAGGDERDVRLWAQLAFLRSAQLIRWSNPLPSTIGATEPADPNELTWFYPGQWFGVERPLASLPLKWLRQAEQDFEYLQLARRRGQTLNALVMARLLTKPVRVEAGSRPDPVYALMSGTLDPQAWQQWRRLMAQAIELRPEGKEADDTAQRDLNLRTLQWMQPLERPLLLARRTTWSALDLGGSSPQLKLLLDVDIYNASDSTPDDNLLAWTAAPSGWQVRPQAQTVSALPTYQVRSAQVEAAVDLSRLSPATRQPVELTFTQGFTRRQTPVRLVLPVAASERRYGQLSIDGSLDDWDPIDAIQNGPLVSFLSRPNLQSQQLQFDALPVQLFSGWADENFYLAFKVSGLQEAAPRVSRNFVDYQFRRAWGEDLCQVLIEAVAADGTSGPALHLVCKPNGDWMERKIDGQWKPAEGGGLRYAATRQGELWRGEVAIPWSAIVGQNRPRPALLRFNFSQHRQSDGQSASWAGPIDHGRDDDLTGVLLLRQTEK